MLSFLAALRYFRTLALVSAGAGLSFILARLRTPAVKLAQVADIEFFRTLDLPLFSGEPLSLG